MVYVVIQIIQVRQMDVVARNKLKKKVAEEFYHLLCKVKKGYRPDYEFILEEISFIDLADQLDDNLSLTILQYYLNNKWQMNLF